MVSGLSVRTNAPHWEACRLVLCFYRGFRWSDRGPSGFPIEGNKGPWCSNSHCQSGKKTISRSTSSFTDPLSKGAAAILEYNTIESPFSQPRNAILGQIFAAIIGVGVTKLFQLNSDFENLRWIAGALSVGITSAFMGLTNTIHPPAGATALLAATTPEITELGWFFLPLILLGSVLLVAVGCVTNNIQRQFPIYWWTGADLGRRKGNDIERQGGKEGKDEGTNEGSPNKKESPEQRPHIMINDLYISIPDWLSLDEDEISTLEVLRTKLREGPPGLENTSSRDTGGPLVRHQYPS